VLVADRGSEGSTGRDGLSQRFRSRRQRFWVQVGDLAARRLPQPSRLPEPPPAVEEPPEAVLEFLRQLGVAMCRAGDSADRVTLILEDVAGAYAAHGVSFFVLPTGVFVRIEAGESSRVDFAPGGSYEPFRLDQIDALYRLIDDIRQQHLPVTDASARLAEVAASPPRFGPLATMLGHGVLTVGLGLMLNPTSTALPVYLLMGLFVGLLRWWADHYRPLDMVFPVATAFAVTWVAFVVVGPLLDAWPLDIVIPSLVTLLPGAALTMATVELSVGSMVSGSARLVYGLQRLLLLTFGIVMGVDLAGSPQGEHGNPLGAWAPWVGVLVFGLGHMLASSAPRGTLRWLLLVLYATYAVQAASGLVLTALGASFVAGAVVPPLTYAVQQRPSGPPVPVTFLPAFWMLVPGALGLQGVTQIVGADAIEGLGDFVNALLSIVAIAAGVLVGTGLSERLGRATSTWRGL
jgi:uncharacterized membrane protein YjjP (DUF1212 family)